jgi:transposase
MAVAAVWVGVDIGKAHHHATTLDGAGKVLLSRRVANTETDLLALLDEVAGLGGTACWAVDVTSSLAGLLLTLLWRRGLPVRYVSGLIAHHQALTWPGEAKTDARDATVIAHTLRTHPGLPQLREPAPLVAELRVLVSHRADVAGQRVATILRLQQFLLAISPALEAAVELTRKGPLLALTYWQTPAAITAAGADRIEALLRRCRIRNATAVADALVAAAAEQTVTLPGQRATAAVVRQLAGDILALDRYLDALDVKIGRLMGRHPLTPIITSLPGMGTLLAAELLVYTNNLTGYGSAAQLAAHAGLAPAARDSGAVTGNHHRPRRYHRDLRRVFYLSALTAARVCPSSRAYYDKKRDEGKNHHQALLALARRRVDVLWALLRDHTVYQPESGG